MERTAKRARLASRLGNMKTWEIFSELADTSDSLIQEVGMIILRIRGIEIK